MEQSNTSGEDVVDLSDVLSDDEENGMDSSESSPVTLEIPNSLEEDNRRIPPLYRLIIKLSGGIIKNENQAKTVAILIIVVANLITLSLIFGKDSGNVSEETLPAISENAGEGL